MQEGHKDDTGKLEWHLMPWNALREVVRVLMYGKSKYGENNWRYLDKPDRRYLNAAIRHLEAHMSGEYQDPESGLPHLAHAACSLLFLLAFRERFLLGWEQMKNDDAWYK